MYLVEVGARWSHVCVCGCYIMCTLPGGFVGGGGCPKTLALNQAKYQMASPTNCATAARMYNIVGRRIASRVYPKWIVTHLSTHMVPPPPTDTRGTTAKHTHACRESVCIDIWHRRHTRPPRLSPKFVSPPKTRRNSLRNSILAYSLSSCDVQ